MGFERGKVALVTGGASGIGLAITKKLLQNGIKGVAIVDISEKIGKEVLTSLQGQYGERVIFIRTDVSKEEELRNAFEKTIEKFKNLDIVFNNAGILDETNWEKTVATNFIAVMRGTFLAIQEYLPKYMSTEETVVMNTASIVGLDSIYPGSPVYITCKHGIVGLAKALAMEEDFKTNKMRVITICPGVVRTPLSPALVAEKISDISEYLIETCKKICSPEYIADSALEILNKGEHGSVWVAEDEEAPYEVVFPVRRALRKT